MTFAAPSWLIALPVLAALLALRVIVASRMTAPSLRVGDGGPLRAAVRSTWRTRSRHLPTALRWLALALVVLALARPREGLALTLVPSEGVDIVVALDTSSSMSSSSLDPGKTRLAAAKEVVSDFVDTLDGDRVGLVIFQERALALSPLTYDYDAVKRRLRDLTSNLLPDGTAIGLGVAEAANLLRESPARSRVIVLLTDGQNNAGEVQPAQAAQIADRLDVRLYTIGFVSRGPTSASADEETLRAIAEETGGAFFDARTGAELAAAYETVGSLERSRVAERRFTGYREYAPWLAGAALALIVLDVTLRSTWLRRTP